MTPRQQRRALDLLREARDTIFDELEAAGPDEVEHHPILASHARTYNKIQRFLTAQSLRRNQR